MASILKVDTIQDQSGNNIINENADTITIGASGDTINIVGTLQNGGTNFLQGITMADQWYAQQDQLLSADTVTVLTGGGTGWSRTPKTLMGSIGLNMSESSGVFTFPSTGIYYINFKCEMTSNNTNNYRVAQANIQGTTDNSTYNTISTSTSNFGAETNSTFTNVNVPYIVYITDTANQKIRFTAYFIGNTGDVIGDTGDDTRTMVTFVRIGDT